MSIVDILNDNPEHVLTSEQATELAQYIVEVNPSMAVQPYAELDVMGKHIVDHADDLIQAQESNAQSVDATRFAFLYYAHHHPADPRMLLLGQKNLQWARIWAPIILETQALVVAQEGIDPEEDGG